MNGISAASFFGFAGVLANIIWPMMRNRSYLLAGQVLACILMFTHFLLLGAMTGAAIMLVAGVQACLSIPLGLSYKFRYLYLCSLSLTPVVCFATWQGVQSAFSSLALATVCFANLQLNQIKQRSLLIFAIFAWVVHNVLVGSTPGLVSNALALTVSLRMLFVVIKSTKPLNQDAARSV